jgi:hypothetical protein
VIHLRSIWEPRHGQVLVQPTGPAP